MHYNSDMVRIEVKRQLGSDIVTREHGKKLRELVTRERQGEPVIVDFGGLQVNSVSFFDEAFGQLALDYGEEELRRKIRFEGLDKFDQALVSDVIGSRSREARKRAMSPLEPRPYVGLQKKRFVQNNIAKLREAGFVENPIRELWFNRERRMAFSHEAIRDMDASWLDRHLAEEVGPGHFVFYMSRAPRDLRICQEILKEIALPNLRANVRLVTFTG